MSSDSESKSETVFQGGSGLTSPVLHGDVLFVASEGSGEVLRLHLASGARAEAETFAAAGGQPQGCSVHPSGALYVADAARQAVVTVGDDGETEVLVQEYEGNTFQGPHSLAFDTAGNLYFTDSGPFGDTSLARPEGSVYCITHSRAGQVLRPIALHCLAYPAGIAVTPDGSTMYAWWRAQHAGSCGC